jgi:formylglycine-generating enzyme required for sulfatase activity
MSVADALTSRRDNAAPLGMIFIAGRTFLMDSDQHYPEEAPIHRESIADA